MLIVGKNQLGFHLADEHLVMTSEWSKAYVEEENRYETACLSCGRLFSDDAVTFVKVGSFS